MIEDLDRQIRGLDPQQTWAVLEARDAALVQARREVAYEKARLIHQLFATHRTVEIAAMLNIATATVYRYVSDYTKFLCEDISREQYARMKGRH